MTGPNRRLIGITSQTIPYFYPCFFVKPQQTDLEMKLELKPEMPFRYKPKLIGTLELAYIYVIASRIPAGRVI